jgi:uncharacterized repeat protein (TIGR03803 family)
MRRWNRIRRTLGFGVAVVLLGACSAAQSPIGAPGVTPQSSALAVRSNSTNYSVVYSFSGSPNGGEQPYAGLIDVRGTLYGTTLSGGKYTTGNLGGTVFSITPSGTENVLHDFGNGTDGSQPAAGLIDVGGTLYGTTSGGGSYYRSAPRCTNSYYLPCGTVFSITPSGTEKVVHSFGGNRGDGLNPVASLIEVNGTLYGTTRNGGRSHRCVDVGCGTVFKITPGGTEKVLHSFGSGTDGIYPLGSLIDVKGTLYGTTWYGGTYKYGGTVFSITLSGHEKVLHSFVNRTDGCLPSAGLINVSGTLYGTTTSCGAYGFGTVFSITPKGTEKVLYSFGSGTDGAGPAAPLIEVNGTLYGTTRDGGPYFCDSGGACGTVFSITPSGTEKVLHSFGSGSDGIHPLAGLIDVDGTLYGTTSGGGAGRYGSYGTVFALTP